MNQPFFRTYDHLSFKGRTPRAPTSVSDRFHSRMCALLKVIIRNHRQIDTRNTCGVCWRLLRVPFWCLVRESVRIYGNFGTQRILLGGRSRTCDSALENGYEQYVRDLSRSIVRN